MKSLIPHSFLRKQLTILTLLSLTFSASAQIEFFDGEEHDVDYNFGYINIFDDTPGVATTVNFTGGISSGSDAFFPYTDDADLAVFDTSEANLLGTVFTHDIISANESTLSMFSGSARNAFAVDGSNMQIFGGFISGNLVSNGETSETGSVIGIFGGQIGNTIEAQNKSIITIEGGTLGSQLVADNGVIAILGSNFAIDGQALVTNILDSSTSGSVLSGVLADGSAFSSNFSALNSGIISLSAIPEPSTYATVLGAFFLLILLRRKIA